MQNKEKAVEKIKRIFVRGMPKQLTIVDGMDLFEVILEMENEKIKKNLIKTAAGNAH